MKAIDTCCPHCGAPLKIRPGRRTVTCEYCGGTSECEQQPEPAVKQETVRAPQVRAEADSWPADQAAAAGRVYRRILLGWIALIILFIAYNTNIAASLLMYGLVYIIGGRAKKKHYEGVSGQAEREKRVKQVHIWKIGLLLVSVLDTILWSLDGGQDLGLVIFLIGVIGAPLTRPWRRK